MKQFLSFGNERFIKSRKRMKEEAEKIGLFDNVIVDVSRFQPEDYFTQLRLKYVAYSRGRFDCWTVASQGKYTLGVR